MALGTPGTWNIGGVNIPDFGITEALASNGSIPSNPNTVNQSVITPTNSNSATFPTASPVTSASNTPNQNIPTNAAPIGSPGANTNAGTPAPKTTTPQSSGGQTDQQKWEALGRSGTAPVGWHGEATGGSTGPSNAELNSVYDPTMNYLKQAEDYINGQQPQIQSTINSQTDSANAELLGNKNKNLTTINENQQTTQNRYEDALAGARRLYDELRRGYGQRFGGSTSAGQAASELASVEQQRQMGQTGRDYNTAVRQIDQQKVQLEQDYQTGQAKIIEQKNLALQQAQTNFTQQLMQIQSQRAQTESQKAAAKLQALTDLRNQAYQTQQQATQYQQNLDMFYKQQQADLTTYAQKLQLSGQGSSTAINQFLNNTTTNPTSNKQVTTGGTPDFNAMALQGNINTKNGYDKYGNPVYSNGTSDGSPLTGSIVQGNYNASQAITPDWMKNLQTQTYGN